MITIPCTPDNTSDITTNTNTTLSQPTHTPRSKHAQAHSLLDTPLNTPHLHYLATPVSAVNAHAPPPPVLETPVNNHQTRLPLTYNHQTQPPPIYNYQTQPSLSHLQPSNTTTPPHLGHPPTTPTHFHNLSIPHKPNHPLHDIHTPNHLL